MKQLDPFTREMSKKFGELRIECKKLGRLWCLLGVIKGNCCWDRSNDNENVTSDDGFTQE